MEKSFNLITLPLMPTTLKGTYALILSPLLFYNQGFDADVVIFDPITYMNVSKNTYRIQEIRNIFMSMYEKIQHFKYRNDYDKNILYFALFCFNQFK